MTRQRLRKTKRITIGLFVLFALAGIFYYEFPSTYEKSNPDYLEYITWLTQNDECLLTPQPKHLPKDLSNKAILTLWDQNIWAGMFTRKPMKRIRHLGDAIKNRHIVTLQELFTTQVIRFPKFETHPYFVYPGQESFLPKRTGLGILSKLKIIETKYILFSQEAGMDRLANKGVFLARVKHPKLGIIDVYTTHLQSPYSNSDYDNIRRSQMNELIDFVLAHSKNHLVILTGDFNLKEDSPLYRELVAKLNLIDVMRQLYPDKQQYPLMTFPKSYKRLDYIFISPSKKWSLDLKDSSARILDLGLSDHLSLCAKLVFSRM